MGDVYSTLTQTEQDAVLARTDEILKKWGITVTEDSLIVWDIPGLPECGQYALVNIEERKILRLLCHMRDCERCRRYKTDRIVKQIRHETSIAHLYQVTVSGDKRAWAAWRKRVQRARDRGQRIVYRVFPQPDNTRLVITNLTTADGQNLPPDLLPWIEQLLSDMPRGKKPSASHKPYTFGGSWRDVRPKNKARKWVKLEIEFDEIKAGFETLAWGYRLQSEVIYRSLWSETPEGMIYMDNVPDLRGSLVAMGALPGSENT
jgi:hypothetical protein